MHSAVTKQSENKSWSALFKNLLFLPGWRPVHDSPGCFCQKHWTYISIAKKCSADAKNSSVSHTFKLQGKHWKWKLGQCFVQKRFPKLSLVEISPTYGISCASLVILQLVLLLVTIFTAEIKLDRFLAGFILHPLSFSAPPQNILFLTYG